MKTTTSLKKPDPTKAQAAARPPYVKPQIKTFEHDEIVDIIGPAMACPSGPGCVDTPFPF